MKIIILLFVLASSWNQSGLATHYGCGWNGRIGASGVKANCHDPVAAHKTLPFGTIVRVTNMDKRTANYGQSSYMMIFDRGPYGAGRILDAMPYPLRDLAGKRVGGLKVKIEVAYTRYQCSGYKCLPKKLKSNRVTGEMLLKLIMKASNGKLNPRND